MSKSYLYNISNSNILKLRTSLIVFTLINISYGMIVFFDVKLWIYLDMEYKMNWIMATLQLCMTGLFIWFNWKMRYNKKKKWENTWKILLLGVIGMWLWIPKKQRLQ